MSASFIQTRTVAILYCSLLNTALPAENVQASRLPDVDFCGFEITLTKMPQLKFLVQLFRMKQIESYYVLDGD